MASRRLLASLFYDIRANVDGLSKDITGAEQQFGKLATFVKANPVAAIAALGVAVAGVAIKAAKMASEVETSLRRVGNAIPDGIAGLDKLRDGIESVSRETGKSQAELARNLQEIARAGVEGPEQAVQRLKAIQTAVDATGEEFSSTVEGLDQTLDLFGGASEDAARALGTLFAAAKGRTSLTDLFASLQAAAPTINRLKLDLDTAARALAALGEKGLSAKQTAAELKRLGEAGEAGRAAIQRLADTIPSAAGGFADMQRAAFEFNNSVDQLNKRSLAQLQGVLIEIGRALLPPIKATLIDILDIIELITGSRRARLKELGLSDLGEKFAESTRKNADVLKLQTASFVRAAKELDAILQKGQLDIVATTTEGQAAVAAGIQHLIDVGVFRAEEVEGVLTRLKQLSQEAAAASGGPLRATGTGGVSKDDLDKQAAAAKKAREEVERLTTRIDELGTAQEIAAGETRLTSKEYATLAVEIIKAKKEFPQFAEVLDGASRKLVGLRQAAAEFEGAELAREIEALLASFTTTTVDDLEIALRALQERLAKQGATEAQIKQITELERSFIAARAASEALDASLSSGRAGGLTPLREMAQRLQEIAEAEEKLAALKNKGAESDRERAELLKQIEELQKRIKELQEENEKATSKTNTATEKFKSTLSDALDVAFGIATALLGADDTLTRMIGSASQVARGLESIAELAREAGGLGKLFSSPAGILSALPGIGSIIGGGAAIASLLGEDPERAKATRELREAADALKRAAGDLARISVAGARVAAIQRAVAGVVVPNFGSGGINRATADVAAGASLSQALRAAGIAMEDFRKVAAELGFDFSKGITAEGLKLFKERLADLDFKAFTNTFAGALDALEQRFQLFEIDEGQDQFDALIDLLTDPVKGAPALFGALDGLDIKTAEGQAKAKKVIQEIFQGLVDGSIDPATLNGLNLDQLRDILTRIFGEIGDAVIDAAQTLADAFDEIDLDLAIAGDQSPLNRAIKRFAAAAETDERFADLLGFNLGTAEGRASAEQFLQSLSIGADEDFKRIILQLLEAIRDIPGPETETRPGEVEIVGRGAQGILETTGRTLADFARTGLILDRDRNALLTQIRDSITSPFTPALIQPPSFSRSLGAATVVSGGSFTISNLTLPPVTLTAIPGETPESTAVRFSRRALEEISSGLADLAREAERARGRTVIAG